MSDEPKRQHKWNPDHLAKARAARSANAKARREQKLAAQVAADRIEANTPIAGSEFAPEPQIAPEEGKAALQQYRQILRLFLPMKDRAKRLAEMARSEDDAISMKAMTMIDNLEGLLAQAKETPSAAPPGPMFVVPEGTDPSRMFDPPVPGDCPYCGRAAFTASSPEGGSAETAASLPESPAVVPSPEAAHPVASDAH